MNRQEQEIQNGKLVKCDPKSGAPQLNRRELAFLGEENTPSLALLGYRRCREYDSRNGEGQDYTLLYPTPESVVLVLADGVSQSFYGQIAAECVVIGLTNYLLDHKPFDETLLAREALIKTLRDLAQQGDRKVQAHKLPDKLSPDMRSVLQKARAAGSQAVFGIAIYNRLTGRLVVSQLGDVRIRVFRQRHANDLMSIYTDLVAANPSGRFSTVATARPNDPTLAQDLVIQTFDNVLGVLLHSDGAEDSWGRTLAGVELEKQAELSLALDRWAIKDDVSFAAFLTAPLRRWASQTPFVAPPEPAQIANRFGKVPPLPPPGVASQQTSSLATTPSQPSTPDVYGPIYPTTTAPGSSTELVQQAKNASQSSGNREGEEARDAGASSQSDKGNGKASGNPSRLDFRGLIRLPSLNPRVLLCLLCLFVLIALAFTVDTVFRGGRGLQNIIAFVTDRGSRSATIAPVALAETTKPPVHQQATPAQQQATSTQQQAAQAQRDLKAAAIEESKGQLTRLSGRIDDLEKRIKALEQKGKQKATPPKPKRK